MSALIKSEPLTVDKLSHYAKLLSANFGLNYLDTKSLHSAKLQMVFEKAIRKGFTLREFDEYFMSFIENQKYPTWTVADFFSKERARTYTFNEVLELSGGTTHGFKCAEINGKKYWVRDEVEV